MLCTLLILLVAIQVGLFVHYNPFLIGRTVVPSEHHKADLASFHVYTDHPVLDQHLNALAAHMPPNDFVAYRNHCLRVLSFAVYHLGQEQQQQGEGGFYFPTIQDINVMALALAYHDMGLWSDGGALDYLEPSVVLLEKAVLRQQNEEAQTNQKKQPVWTERDLATAREIILQHHKLTEWKPATSTATTTSSSSSLLVNAHLVNHVRRGDWADATMGLIRFGLPSTHLQLAYEKLPGAGFHAMLAGMGTRLSPDSFLGRLQLLKIFKF